VGHADHTHKHILGLDHALCLAQALGRGKFCFL
jgi:hypothetical protein